MWLAGIPVAGKAVLRLAASLRKAELNGLERAYDHEARIVALDVPDREAILRVLEECPRSSWSCGRRCFRSTSGGSGKVLSPPRAASEVAIGAGRPIRLIGVPAPGR